ncbi:MAG: ATP-dependent DNA helicase RecG [Spirochaetales bacterium]|nr:ATP-dependent DNA helicase RecG [Spirochaetales bacterium]
MFIRECRTSVLKLKGIGPAAARSLADLGITQVWQLLEYYPRAYQDRTQAVPFSGFAKAEINTVAEVIAHDYIHFRGKKVLKVWLRDKSADAAIVCFGRNFLESQLGQGTRIFIAGPFQFKFGEIQSSSFDFEPYSEAPRNFLKILPVYPLSGKLTQGILRTAMHHAVQEYARFVDDELPESIMASRKLCSKAKAIEQVHFPSSMKENSRAVHTLKFEELFYFQLILARKAAMRKKAAGETGPVEFNGVLYEKALSSLPFALTADQQTAISEIRNELGTGMNRLLQGDVGAGKTLVALLCATFAAEKKWQTALMAPTELLARQHASNAAELFGPAGLHVAYISGGTPPGQKKHLLEALKNGDIDVVVGTHSLFSGPMQYHKLRFIIIDEQQRFGVDQRSSLYEKGTRPDILLMSATPIPRTLALTAFGDMGVSVIKTMPPGRLPVITHLCMQGNEEKVYTFVRRELAAGHQAYFVYPLLEESASLDLKAAETMAEELQVRFPDYPCALIHGRLKEEEKTRIMSAFKARDIAILVATSVVEVGVDVANATCMVIEHAERFGLSALHQLRGRVGRSSLQAYAFLVYSGRLTEDGKARLKTMKQTVDGFIIAEEDLKIRGPGELLGARQSGYIPFKLADIVTDLHILMESRDLAGSIAVKDPGLLGAEHAVMRVVLNKVPPFTAEIQ